MDTSNPRRDGNGRTVREGKAYLEGCVPPHIPHYQSVSIGATSTKPWHKVSDEGTRPMLSIYFNQDNNIPSELFETLDSSAFLQLDQFYMKGDVVVFEIVYTGKIDDTEFHTLGGYLTG